MEKSELIKLLLAAVVGGLLKELVAWLISFTKVSLFGPMWKHSRGVITDLLACCFYGVLLGRFGMTDGAATKLDVLLTMGCGLGFLVCAISLLVSVAKWKVAREAAGAAPATTGQ
jgi:hypothetical protein